MKKILVLSATLLTLAAPLAMAGGIDFAWDACASNGGTASTVFPCADPSGLVNAYGTFVSDVTLTNIFTAIDAVIDLQTDAPVLTPFWDIQTAVSPSSCNNAVLLNKARSAGNCGGAANLWGPGGGAATTNIGYGPQFGGVPNRGRIVAGVFRSAASPTTVNAGTNYWGFELQFLTGSATEAGGSCSGCTGGATLVLNEIKLSSISDARTGIEAPAVVITNPGSVGNCVSAGGATTPCSATPVKSKTWGTLKSLYR